jgi:hypothetical protein
MTNTKLKIIFLTLCFTKAILAQDPQVYNYRCGSIMQEPVASRKGADTEYIKGDKMFLCLNFFPFGIRIPYQLVVDEYNMIEVKHCNFY